MNNKENGNYRPHYYAIKDAKNEDILWMIPISSQVEKYKKIIQKKIQRYGKCNTIVIGIYGGKENAFLIQNAFPVIDKYLDHIHTIENKPIQIHKELDRTLNIYLKQVLAMQKRGINLLFTDIEKIKKIMETELDGKWRIFAFENGTINQYEGGFTDYQARKQEEGYAVAENSKSTGKTSSDNKSGDAGAKSLKNVKNRQDKLKFSYKEQKEYETIDADIAALEEKIEQLEQDLVANARDFVKLNEITKQKEEAEAALEEKMERWMYLQDLAERIEAQNS